jgi:hypothetical protein
MARDTISIQSLTANAGTAATYGTPVSANGAVISAGGDTSGLVLHVKAGTATAGTITIGAGDNPPAFRAGLGAATVVVAASGETFIVLESARFAQSDGTLEIDWSASLDTVGRVAAYRFPAEI